MGGGTLDLLDPAGIAAEVGQAEPDGASGEPGRRALGPLDERDRVAVEQLVEPEPARLGVALDAVEVEVEERAVAVLLDDRERGRGDAPAVQAQPVGGALDEVGLAGAQVARERDHVAGSEPGGQAPAEVPRLGGAGGLGGQEVGEVHAAPNVRRGPWFGTASPVRLGAEADRAVAGSAPGTGRVPGVDTHVLLFILVGFGLWGAVALERPLQRLPVSLPMLYVALGWAAFALPLGLPRLDPVGTAAHTVAAEYLTEFIVVVSLAGAGIAIDRPFSWAGWRQVWPLLGVTMPLSIGVVAVLGWGVLGLGAASAILLGAALSPTDPVLARSVQVGPPGESDRDDVRFDLTVEAGLNDGLAFPFTYLAIAAVGATGLGRWTAEWAAVDVVWQVAAGLAVGVAVGRAGAWYVFERSAETGDDGHADPGAGGGTNEGVVVMGTLLAAYGLAEAVEGYGFLAVFAGAVAARQRASGSDYHRISHHFVDQLEKLVLVGMLLGLGGLVASGILAPLTVPAALVGASVVLVVRPLAGIVGMLRCPLPWPGRWAVAGLGVRGMGTLYYLAYAQTRAGFEGMDVVWATATFAILVSVVVHGVAAGPVMRWVERHDLNVVPGAERDVAPQP